MRDYTSHHKTEAKHTASLYTAEQRLARAQAAKTLAKLKRERELGRLTETEEMTLGLIVGCLLDNSDGQFAQVLVQMIQGEF